MKFYVANPNKRKQVYDILNIFYDHDELIFDDKAGLRIEEGKIILKDKNFSYKDDQLKEKLYQILTHLTGYQSPWGYLTGSKPSKLLQKMSLEEIKKKYLLSDEKIKLLAEVKSEQDKLAFDRKAFSVYINIPFCPSFTK